MFLNKQYGMSQNNPDLLLEGGGKSTQLFLITNI